MRLFRYVKLFFKKASICCAGSSLTLCFIPLFMPFEMENVKGANLIWVEDYRGPIENYGVAKMTTLMGILCLKIQESYLTRWAQKPVFSVGAHTVI